MVAPLDAFARILVALLIGLLVGLDRERAEVRKRRAVFAGVRTFPLIALAGVIPALIVDAAGPWLIVAAFLTLSALTVVAYYRSSAAGDVGATTETAAVVTFLLGVVVGFGHLLLAGATPQRFLHSLMSMQ